jgi:hypothetical protein
LATDRPGALDSSFQSVYADGSRIDDRRDVRIFTMIFNALIYLNRFGVEHSKESIDIMTQSYSRVFFSTEPTSEVISDARQYRGTVTLGQMMTHSMFSQVRTPLENDDNSRTSSDRATRYYIPIAAPSRCSFFGSKSCRSHRRMYFCSPNESSAPESDSRIPYMHITHR